MPDTMIEHLAPMALQPWERNARTHSKAQIRRIADSIETQSQGESQCRIPQ